MKYTTKTRTVMATALALALATPLAGCGGQATQGGSSDTSAQQTTEQTSAPLDVSSWKTLGDALAFKEESNHASSWDEGHIITAFQSGDRMIYVVATMTPDVYKQITDLDASADDHDEQMDKTISGLAIETAKDVTDQQLSQADLDAYVGKTGQDLLDAGFTFASYFMYGGEETGATFDKDYFSYNVTFDTTVEEDKTEDEGAALVGATITNVDSFGFSDSILDPSAL